MATDLTLTTKEEDVAPLRGADGEALTFEQKSKIMQGVDEAKRAAKKEQMAIASKKKAAALGISIKKKDDNDNGQASSSSSASAAGGGTQAVKALLSPSGKAGDKAKAESPAGGGVKAALALKSGGGGKGKASGGGGTKKGGGGKKKSGLLDKAKEAALEAQPAAAEAPAAEAALPPETAEERTERLLREEREREEERNRAYKEREEQRQEIEMAIIEEERRLRAKEQKKREQEKAERRKQLKFREAAFDGEVDVIKAQLAEWVEETFGATLLGAKVDCMDENKTTPLSEAACAGQTEIVKLLVEHGASINLVNSQNRTPLWRAAFMDKRETAEYLLSVGGDPRLKADSGDSPAMVAPSAELTALFEGWDAAKTDELIVAREKALEGQWVPPPPAEEDQPAGQAGYFLQIGLARFADALDSVTEESDRPILVADLSGKVATYFEYRDCNMHCYARPADIEPDRLRKGLLGALRYGKPFVLDMMSMELEEEAIRELFDSVQPKLLDKILSKKIMKEEHYLSLVAEGDDEQYNKVFWNEATTAHYTFVLRSKRPLPPEWCAEGFFIIRVA